MYYKSSIAFITESSKLAVEKFEEFKKLCEKDTVWYYEYSLYEYTLDSSEHRLIDSINNLDDYD